MDNTLLIRPEARLIKSIGADLIKDYYAAVIELVKNAYDADSDKVTIVISLEETNLYGKIEEYLKFIIIDTGEGMSLETIKNAWMVPATSYKLNKKTSNSKKRLFQGRKGIGRYASAILGDYLRMETTDLHGETTIIEIDWKQFESIDENNIKYLDEIEIEYENEKTDLQHGTKIEIYSPVIKEINEKTKMIEERINWTKTDYKNLLKELRNLLSPLEKNIDDKFDIKLIYDNLEKFDFISESIEIEPFPILNLYDYRISGKVKPDGTGILLYENQNFSDSEENISFKIKIDTQEEYCGLVDIDLRFFDLEPEAIQELINRGLKDPLTNEYLGKAAARHMLKEYIGVGVYRNLFRIRPYGDSNYDWLELNQKRVNNPTVKFSTNQVVGFINIASEEESNLIEKSAREGLKENKSYETLKTILSKAISEVEVRRYQFRINSKRGRKPTNSIKDAINDLFSFDNVSYKIRTMLETLGIDNAVILKVEKTLKDEEKSKVKELEKVQDTLVMYEAHAALGRLVQLVIHEGRKPLQFIGDNLNNLKSDLEYFIKHTDDIEVQNDILVSVDTNKTHLKTISKLFSNLDPLTAKRLSKKKEFSILKSIKENCDFFKNQFEVNNISLEIVCDKDIMYYGRTEDFFIIYTNLIENSIYWLKTITSASKLISFNIYMNNNNIIVDYQDNGPGINSKFANDIFNAGFSTKPEGGTGIGLTLSGQAISRNNGQLEWIKSDIGAFFRLTLKGKDKND
jgi:signal transduction histidine kinase